VDDAPQLEAAHQVLLRLVTRLTALGELREAAYLRSSQRRHRWGHAGFPSLEDEFRFKVTWVARELRERLGSPDHQAFLHLANAQLTGLRAAAWTLGAAVGYVSLRSRGRTRFDVVLGAMRPSPPPPSGPDGLDAHAAVWAEMSPRIH
jgi:hypothetical protein